MTAVKKWSILGSHNCDEETPIDKYIAKLRANMMAVSTECVYFSELLSPLAVQKEKNNC